MVFSEKTQMLTYITLAVGGLPFVSFMCWLTPVDPKTGTKMVP
jgi:hypothetical protein